MLGSMPGKRVFGHTCVRPPLFVTRSPSHTDLCARAKLYERGSLLAEYEPTVVSCRLHGSYVRHKGAHHL